jgi:hypothetical protein
MKPFMNAQQKLDDKDARRIKRLTDICYTASYDDPTVTACRVALSQLVEAGATEDDTQKARWNLKDAIIKASWKNGTIDGTRQYDMVKIHSQIINPK